MRAIICFKKQDEAVYISHLDLQRTVDRALRRSGVEAVYSEGFNPHIKMSFAFALKVGMPSESEYLEVELADGTDIRAAESAIRASFPGGLPVNWVREKKEDTKKLMASVTKAEYRAAPENTECLPKIQKAIEELLSLSSLLLTKTTRKGPREFDARPLIGSLEADTKTSTVRMLLSAQEAGTLDPRLLMDKILLVAGVDTVYTVSRQDLFTTVDGETLPLSALAKA